jgi:cystathionine beta-lyase
MKKRHNWDIEENWVEFVTGVVPGAIFCIQSFTNPGDKIVCFGPLFGPLRHAVVDNGRQLVESSFINKDECYSINFEDLEKKLSDSRAKMFILCNPHNPVGKVFTKEELMKIGELCLKHHVLIFNDEIHGDIVYKGHTHVCMASLSEKIKNITITGLNPGKTFNVGGMRTAAVIIPNKTLRDRFLIARKNCKAMGRNIFGQVAFIACYRDCEYYLDQMLEYLEGNLNYVESFIKEKLPEIKFHRPEGLYLLWLNCKSLGLEQNQLMKLFEEVGKIGLNSGTDFGPDGKGYVRINIAAPYATVVEGMNRIEKVVASLR